MSSVLHFISVSAFPFLVRVIGIGAVVYLMFGIAGAAAPIDIEPWLMYGLQGRRMLRFDNRLILN